MKPETLSRALSKLRSVGRADRWLNRDGERDRSAPEGFANNPPERRNPRSGEHRILSLIQRDLLNADDMALLRRATLFHGFSESALSTMLAGSALRTACPDRCSKPRLAPLVVCWKFVSKRLDGQILAPAVELFTLNRGSTWPNGRA